MRSMQARRPKACPRFWPQHLDRQLALLTAILLAAAILVITLYSLDEESRHLADHFKEQSIILSRNLANTNNGGLLQLQPAVLDTLLKHTAEFPGVNNILLVRADGNILREVVRQQGMKPRILSNNGKTITPEQAKSTIKEFSDRILIWYPIIGTGLQGWVRIDYSLAIRNEEVSEIITDFLIVGILSIGVAILILLIYLRRPMTALRKASEFAGNLDNLQGGSIKLNSTCHETQVLGEALNNASMKLHDQDQAIRSTLVDLEAQQYAMDEHAIISITDTSGFIIYANDKFCEISGNSLNELVGRNHRIVKSDYHPKEYFDDLWNTIRSGKVWHGEICNKNKQDKLYWVNTTIVPFLDNNNEPYQYVAIRNDITDIKMTTQALRDSRERLRCSQEFANIGTWDWEFSANEVYCSDRVGPIYGYEDKRRSFSYQDFLLAIHPQDRDEVLKKTDACLRDGKAYDIEYRIIWPDESVHWIHASGNVRRNEEDQAIHMLGIVQDISRRKKTEHELKQSQEVINQSQKMQAIGTLAGGIAHDFNNILFAVIGYIELVQIDSEEDTEIHSNAHEAIKGLQRASDLVNQILTFSRKSPEEKRAMQPKYVLKEALKLLRSSITSSIDMRQHIDTEAFILIDPTRLHQVVMNLCVNASHAIGRGTTGVITTNLESVEIEKPLQSYTSVLQKGTYIRLSVADSGCGIDDKNLEHIFEPFFTTKEEGEGTGMGLAAVYGIVSDARGGIVVESCPGEGTTFTVYIPVTDYFADEEHREDQLIAS
ncbi:MAG: hypothetical protein BMS9Abin26_1367 [Gammaproteobacteria bacterium]|nr:MAG: hypothetical protein BMS9Abin26_1367 [Gammaproteobacteria bacterium]